MTPVMVALIVAMHAWSSPDSKTFSLMALVFMVLMTGLTCSLHFVILTLGRQPVGVFPVAAALLALLSHRTAPYEPLQPLAPSGIDTRDSWRDPEPGVRTSWSSPAPRPEHIKVDPGKT